MGIMELTPLARLRRQAGLSQAEVAALVGVSQQHLAAWERGKYLPRPAAQRALASAYGVTPALVFDAAEGTQRAVSAANVT